MASDDKHRDKHADNMRRLGQAWATPLMIVFSLGALISLGQSSIGLFIHAISTHTWTAQLITDLAILAIAFVGVVGMDLVLINNAIDMRDLQLRNMPVPAGLRGGTYGIAAVEALTFAYVAWQLDNPPSFAANWPLALTIWGFIIMRAVAFPAAAIRLATLGKRPVMLRQILQDHLIVVGDRLATEIQDPSRQFTIPQLLEMMVADEEGGNAKTQGDVVAAAQKLIKIYDQPAAAPMAQIAAPRQEADASQDSQAQAEREADPTLEGEIALRGQLPYTSQSPELRNYILPDGISLTTNDSKVNMAALLGISRYQDISRAMSEAEMAPAGSISGQASNAQNVAVWQILSLIEGGLLDMPTRVTKRDLAIVR